MSVNDLAYDKDDVVNSLKEIEQMIPQEEMTAFKWYANEIECAVDYLIARLADEQVARFGV